MTPLKIVYGRNPPVIVKFQLGETKVEAIAQSLQDRDEMILELKHNLTRA